MLQGGRVAVLVAALVAALLPSGSGSAQESAADVVRVAGAGRVETAVAVSAAGWETAEAVIVATAGAFADALAGGALAARLDAPLLLTPSEALPAAVLAEIERLGAGRAVLLGGSAAISEVAAGQLVAAGVAVERIAGADRFATAAAAAAETGIGDEVLVALGGHADANRAWPDALSAGAFAAVAERPPLVLVTAEGVPAATREALTAAGVADLRVVGGSAAIPDAVVTELAGLAGQVQRLSGASRYATSATVAREVLDRLPHDAPAPLVVASGANFPDGLAAAALAARQNGVLVLVPPRRLLDAPTMIDFLNANRARFAGATVIGGTAAITEATRADIADVLAGRSLAPDGPSEPPPAGTPTFGTPDPLAVQPVLADAAAATVQVIPGEAASVSATGADGTRYILDIPQGAVVLATTVTLTPLQSLSGDPFAADHLAGVDISPHGLRLFEPATLTIEPADAVPPEQVSTWAYLDDGQDFHLHPAVVTESIISFDLLHFSGYGGTPTTAAEREQQAQNVPADLEARYLQAAAEVMRALRDRELTQEEASEKVGRLLLGYYDQIVRPALHAGLDDDAAGRQAVAVYTAWARQLELLGLDVSDEADARIREGKRLVEQIVVNAFDRAYRRCVDDHDLVALRDMLEHLRSAELLGFGDRIPDGYGKLDRCATFELDFTGTTHENLEDFAVSVETRTDGLRLELDLYHGVFQGSGPIQELTAQVTNLTDPGDNCAYRQSGSAVPGDIWVVVVPDLVDPDRAPTLQMLATGGQNPASMTVQLVCQDSAQEFPYYPLWSAVQFTLMDACGCAVIEDWDIHPTGSTYATAVFSHSGSPFGGNTYDVELRLTLRHAP